MDNQISNSKAHKVSGKYGGFDWLKFWALVTFVVMLVGGLIYKASNTKTSTVELRTLKSGDLITTYEYFDGWGYPRLPVVTIIHPTTGEETYCRLNRGAKVRVIGTLIERVLLIVHESQISKDTITNECQIDQEVMSSLSDVTRWKNAEEEARNRKTLDDLEQQVNLLLVRAIKAEANGAPR